MKHPKILRRNSKCDRSHLSRYDQIVWDKVQKKVERLERIREKTQ